MVQFDRRMSPTVQLMQCIILWTQTRMILIVLRACILLCLLFPLSIACDIHHRGADIKQIYIWAAFDAILSAQHIASHVTSSRMSIETLPITPRFARSVSSYPPPH